jgi:hypothetical protein
MMRHGGIELIDLEKDRLAIGFEGPKVMFLVRIVGVAEIVVDGDCLDDAGNSLGAKGGDAASHHGCAFTEVLTQVVVECANAIGLSRLSLSGHCGFHGGWPMPWRRNGATATAAIYRPGDAVDCDVREKDDGPDSAVSGWGRRH